MKALLLAATLIWSPLSHTFVTPDVLDQQGFAEYGSYWLIVKPVVVGGYIFAIPKEPSAPVEVEVR